MRTLLLLRGAPGCGKSTFIEKNGLKPYALSADDLRLLYSSPKLTAKGDYVVDQKNDGLVWANLFDILKHRLDNGEFTVIDACNSKSNEMSRYVKIAKEHKYRIFIVDFTDVPMETCIERNVNRGVKSVPKHVIENMYSRFKTQKVPSGIKVIKPDQLQDLMWRKIDLNDYKKVVVFGDIHGCYTAFKEGLEKAGGYTNENFYIFVGDYLDRGIENAETLKYLIELSKKDNVMLLEGNHEKHLDNFAHDKEIGSYEFKNHTAPQLNEAGISKSDINAFYRKLSQVVYFTFDGLDGVVTHAGLSRMPEELLFIDTTTFIKGVGNYNDIYDCENSFFESAVGKPIIQIHGHRNPCSNEIFDGNNSYNLEGSVEQGGHLRVMTMEHNPGKICDPIIETYEIKNHVFRTGKEPEIEINNDTDVAALIKQMRESRYIKENNFGNISSFGFTSKAFQKRKWNGVTTKARGLYIDITRNKLMGRAYDKFFNINEMPETDRYILAKTFEYPVYAYVKENGFLGIVFYDDVNDTLCTCSKNSMIGYHADILKTILTEKLGVEGVEKLKDYCKERNVSILFEVIDPINDPHIIKYGERELFLLDIIENSVAFKKKPYQEVVELGSNFGLCFKKCAYKINNQKEYFDFLTTVEHQNYKYDGEYIEGFVLEDQSGFMTKLKLYYYNEWKYLRGVMDKVFKYGVANKTSGLVTPIQNNFYRFLRDIEAEATKDVPNIRETRRELRRNSNIIDMREKFFEERAKGNYV